MTTLRNVALIQRAAALLIVAASGCAGARRGKEAYTEFRPRGGFTDVTLAAGITSVHHKPVLDHQLDNIMSWVCSVGAAAAAGDYNRDGWIDLYVTDSDKGQPNHLYRNNGDGTFTDVAKQAGLADLNNEDGTSMDAVWGDYDNDGWPDLYVVKWGRDLLFHNNRDGTFTDVTARLFRRRDGAPGTDWANGNAAVFFDYDRDGRLDIYVGNYFSEVDLWHLKSTRIMHDDFEKARNGGRNFLYHQESDGTFTEVAASLGVDDPGWTLAVGSADVNNDGWPDLYCADDFGPDQLFLNTGDGHFRNIGETALGIDSKKGMNVDFGDFDNDGWLDIYVSNITTTEYLQEGNMLWHNDGPTPDGSISFTDVGLETGTYDGGWGWGAKFFDYDNDGKLDIVAVNGFISAGEGNYWYDLASWTVLGQDPAEARNWPTIGNRSFSGYERKRLWHNDGLHSFSERARQLGIDCTHDGRGVVTFDYDNDGDLDLFMANQGAPPKLYRNDVATGNHWIEVALEADQAARTNRDAIGARLTVVTAGGRQIRERDAGNGYCGHADPRLHLGLGKDERVQLLEVRWPDGGLQYLENVPADRLIKIRQDPAHYTATVATSVGPPQVWAAREAHRATAPEPDPAELDRHLADIEDHLRQHPSGFALASRYRQRCASTGRHDRSIDFFKKLVAEQPDDVVARVEFACAYVDKIPTCGGLAAIVSKGTLARQSLDQLDRAIAQKPDLWVAYYARGMNHLHWPRALLHSDAAAADFARCLEIQKRRAEPRPKSYYLRTYLGLGDAQAKAKKFDQARKTWRDGLKVFPDSPELKDRLASRDDNSLLKYVESQRSLEQPIDTDLSFLDREP